MWYNLARKCLFTLPPETAHKFTLKMLNAFSPFASKWSKKIPHKSCEYMGLHFPNQVGIAAGFDKNGDCIEGLFNLGFGFVEIGTVTPKAQIGNEKPRMFRLTATEALINRLGFNNQGVQYLVDKVSAANFDGILGINIGRGFDTSNENAIDDYVASLRLVYDHASYVTINISSPNTAGLRDLQGDDYLSRLLLALKNEQSSLITTQGRYVPLAVKISPDLTDEQLRHTAGIIVEHNIDAVIATNTTVSREGVSDLRYADEKGGLSGRPLFAKSLHVVSVLNDALQGRATLIACGGISSADDARKMLDAGANLLQLYTGFVYQGPKLLKDIVAAV